MEGEQRIALASIAEDLSLPDSNESAEPAQVQVAVDKEMAGSRPKQVDGVVPGNWILAGISDFRNLKVARKEFKNLKYPSCLLSWYRTTLPKLW